jgi:hypothetical protein
LLMAARARDCREVVEQLLERLSAHLYSSITKARPLSLAETAQYIAEFVKTGGSCIDLDVPDSLYLAFLERELEKISNMLLDKAMEALSKHMELVDADVHNLLSVVLTNYALHETRVATTFYELVKRYGKRVLEGDEFTATVLRTMEEAVFAAIARFLALTKLIARMSPDELRALARSIAETVDAFMREENSTIIVAAYHISGLLG